MTGNDGSRAGLTRRSFLKTAGATAGALGIAGAAGMTATSDWLAPTQAHAEPEERVGYTFHQNHCTGHCSLKCTVRDGRLCIIEPNKAFGDKRYETVCARGLSEIQHVYSAERIQTPLKRVGERGSDQFEAISWDEALAVIKENIERIWSDYGKDAVVVAGTSDVKVRYPHLQKLFGAQSDGLTGIDVGVGCGIEPALGVTSNFGIASNEPRDWVNTKTLINFSTNFLESSLVTGKTFFEAQEAGCKIITIDPHYTATACKSDQWIPIEPGSDGALVLAMISCVIDNGWLDEEFMKHKTSFPYLVNSETGAMLRRDPGADANTKGIDNPFMVWDSLSNTLAPYDAEGIDPLLNGSHEIDDSVYVTVFDLLREKQKSYTLAWAKEKTQIDEDVIEELAREYALNTPSCISVGWGGSDKYTNADICGHAMAILAALTGNLGKPGTGVGVYVGGVYSGYAGKLASWPLPKDAVAAKMEMPTYEMRSKKNRVRAYIALGDMFQQHYANMNLTDEWLKSLEFIVYVDMYHSTSARWADIVLPACTKFETHEEITSLKWGYGHLLGQGKVLDPLFDSKPDFEIERLLADALGVGDALPETAVEWCEYQIAKSTDPKMEGWTLKQLIDNDYVLALPGIEVPRFTYDKQVAGTRSGRVDVYFENMIGFDQQLPTYDDPDEVYLGNERRATYPLQFYQARTKYQIHSMFCDATWIKQYYEPHVEMSPVDMKERGIVDGDVVEVFNDRGSFKVPVRTSRMVRPKVIRMFEGIWTKYTVEGNLQNVTNDKMNERTDALALGAAIPFQDTLVEVKKA